MTRSDVNTLLNSLFGFGKMSKAKHRQSMDATLDYVDSIAPPDGALADGSVTEPKLSPSVQLKLNQVSSGAGSPNYVYATQVGIQANNDVNLDIGSTASGPDATVNVNNTLQALSNAGGGVFCMDTKAVVTQIVIPDNIVIFTPNPAHGFIQKTGTNKPMVINKGRGNGTDYVNGEFRIISKNIVISGGTWNGNAAGNQVKETAEGWTIIFRFSGIRNLSVKDVRLVEPCSFCSFVNNFETVRYENIHCIVNRSRGYGNSDGCKFIHGRDLEVNHIFGNTKDDLWSIGTEDIFHRSYPLPVTAGQSAFDPGASRGDLFDVLIKNTVFDRTDCGCRIIGDGYRMDRIVIDGISGTLSANIALLIDNYTAGGSPEALYRKDGPVVGGNAGSITIRNMNVVDPTTAYFASVVLGFRCENFTIQAIINDFSSPEPFLYVMDGAISDKITLALYGRMNEGDVGSTRSMVLQRGKVGVYDFVDTRFNTKDGQVVHFPIIRHEAGIVGSIDGMNVKLPNSYPFVEWKGGELGGMQTIGIRVHSAGMILDNLTGSTLASMGVTSGNAAKPGYTGPAPAAPYGDFFGTTTSGGGGGDTPTDPGNTGATATSYTTLIQRVRAAGGTVGTALETRSKEAEATWRANGLMSLLRIMYPALGQTGATKGLNLINSLDTNGAFRITWTPGWDFSGVGFKNSLLNQNNHGETHYAPAGKTPTAARAFGFWSLDSGPQGRDFGGVVETPIGAAGDQLHLQFTDGNTYYGAGTIPATTAFLESAIAFFCVTIDSSRLVKIYRNMVLVHSYTATGADNTSMSYWLGNMNGLPMPSDRRLAYVFAGAMPTVAQLTSYYVETKALLELQGIVLPA